ncbi:argininosuccinate lyase [Lysobacter sp. HA18]
MSLLWQKGGVEVDARIQSFLAGDDVLLDREFFLHDIDASRAHARGLVGIGILSQETNSTESTANWLRLRRRIATARSCSTRATRTDIPRSRTC